MPQKSRLNKALTQRDMRQGIDVSPGWNSVMTVRSWHIHGHFKNEDEAQGAYKLAYQQGLDGMGKSINEWMGLSAEELSAWMANHSLPKIAKKYR